MKKIALFLFLLVSPCYALPHISVHAPEQTIAPPPTPLPDAKPITSDQRTILGYSPTAAEPNMFANLPAGGDKACMNFATQYMNLYGVNTKFVCMAADASPLFSITCAPATSAMVFTPTVHVVVTPPSCAATDH